MEAEFPFTEIPEAMARLAGDVGDGTRVFKREGSHAEMAEWFDALCEHIGPCVSPGGAANYGGVTRAGVYKRLKSGGLTAFCFRITGKTKTQFGGEKKLKEWPIVYIPVSECQAWRREMESRIKGKEAGVSVPVSRQGIKGPAGGLDEGYENPPLTAL
jgi:hypothetical protein